MEQLAPTRPPTSLCSQTLSIRKVHTDKASCVAVQQDRKIRDQVIDESVYLCMGGQEARALSHRECDSVESPCIPGSVELGGVAGLILPIQVSPGCLNFGARVLVGWALPGAKAREHRVMESAV